MAFAARRTTPTVHVGNVAVGSCHPIVVQSMTNTDTADVAGTVRQVAELARAGSELVRVTVNNEEAARAVPQIVEGLDRIGVHVPIIGDFHYNGHLLLTRHPDCAAALAKFRINPGNVGGKHADTNFRAIIEVALAHGKPVRIGVNWGSLDQLLLTELMDANARLDEPHDARDVMMEAMVQSAVRSAAFAGALLIGFQIVLTHWFYLYIPWFMPCVAVALYAARPGLAPERVVEHVPLRVGVERRDGVPGPFARRLPA